MALQRKTLREQIKEVLIERIVSGKMRSGDRLIEMRIAEDLGTSQAPVREALRELAAIGFVTIRPHRGTVVRDFSASELREIYVVRGALEEAGTRLATPRFAGDVSQLQFQIDAMLASARRHDLHGMCRHSVQFHRLIMEQAGNDLLLGMWTSLQIETRTIITLLAPGLDLTAIARTHQPLADAIRAGDVELACRLAREHQTFFEDLPTIGAGAEAPREADLPAA